LNSDSKKRTVVKMISYRIVIFALLMAITYYFTGNAGQTTTISIIFNVAGSVVYYVYERLWGAIGWGKSRPRQQLAQARVPTSPIPINVNVRSEAEANHFQEN
jgi:uncharacterized membrane protein